jgi:hypothetical protein
MADYYTSMEIQDGAPDWTGTASPSGSGYYINVVSLVGGYDVDSDWRSLASSNGSQTPVIGASNMSILPGKSANLVFTNAACVAVVKVCLTSTEWHESGNSQEVS